MSSYKSPFFSKYIRVSVLRSQQPAWLNRDNENIIYLKTTDPTSSLFDAIYSTEDIDESSNSNLISSWTLREVSESYQFSLSYLGDFATQVGCQPPIDVDTPIGNFLTGDQISILMEALTTLDPFECNIEYDSMTVEEISASLGTTVDEVITVCNNRGINLPFGPSTVLHNSLVGKIRDLVESGDDDADL